MTTNKIPKGDFHSSLHRWMKHWISGSNVEEGNQSFVNLDLVLSTPVPSVDLQSCQSVSDSPVWNQHSIFPALQLKACSLLQPLWNSSISRWKSQGVWQLAVLAPHITASQHFLKSSANLQLPLGDVLIVPRKCKQQSADTSSH